MQLQSVHRPPHPRACPGPPQDPRDSVVDHSLKTRWQACVCVQKDSDCGQIQVCCTQAALALNNPEA